MSDPRKSKSDADEIVEDAPIMRSVTMMPAPSPITAFPPPMPGRSVFSESSLLKQSPSLSKSALFVPKELKEGHVWKPKALALPLFYQLARSRVAVRGASAQEVANRIAECIRKESIAAVYDDEQGCARLETSSCLKLCVRLWKDDDKITVECQRSAGCCFSFQQTAKTILRAANAESCEHVTPLPIPKSVPSIPVDIWEQATIEDIALACESLRSKRLDANVMALESLMQLSVAAKCRLFCAKQILSTDGASEILDILLDLIQCSGSKCEDELLTDMEKDQIALMHRYALIILGNCLGSIEHAGDLTMTIQSLPELTSELTIRALTNDVAQAYSKPHEAAASCRCLRALAQTGCAAVACDTLRSATRFAAESCRHAALEEESRKLMNDL